MSIFVKIKNKDVFGARERNFNENNIVLKKISRSDNKIIPSDLQ